jgi:hypothetical protein
MTSIDPWVVHCILHGVLISALRGFYLVFNLIMSSQACEWAVLTALAWYMIDSRWLWREVQDAERNLASLVNKCDASLKAIHELSMRYESIDRRCQAVTMKQLRARDKKLREMNWVAFCRRALCLEHMRALHKEPLSRSSSFEEFTPSYFARSQSLR